MKTRTKNEIQPNRLLPEQSFLFLHSVFLSYDRDQLEYLLFNNCCFTWCWINCSCWAVKLEPCSPWRTILGPCGLCITWAVIHLIIVPGGSFASKTSCCAVKPLRFGVSTGATAAFLARAAGVVVLVRGGTRVIPAVDFCGEEVIVLKIGVCVTAEGAIGVRDGGVEVWMLDKTDVAVVVWIFKLATGAVEWTTFMVCTIFCGVVETVVKGDKPGSAWIEIK